MKFPVKSKNGAETPPKRLSPHHFSVFIGLIRSVAFRQTHIRRFSESILETSRLPDSRISTHGCIPVRIPGDIHSIFFQIILKLCINLIQHILFAAGHIQWRNLFSVRNSFFHQPFHIERTVNQTFHFSGSPTGMTAPEKEPIAANRSGLERPCSSAP